MTKITDTCIEPYLDSFMRSFAAANYKPETIRGYRNLFRRLGLAMEEASVAPSALTPDLAEKLGRMAEPESTGTIRLYSLGRKFAAHLIEIGVARPVAPTPAEVVRGELLADFEIYLTKQRGLSPRSIYHTLRFADRFMDHRFGADMIDLTGLRPVDAVGFVQHLLSRGRPYRDKSAVTHLRTFFQYLFARGMTATNLALSVPRAAMARDKRLPRHLSSSGVEAVLDWVRRNPRHGVRDYAMLLIMARLGLRAPEIIRIELGDIDWRSGELMVRGKGKLHDRVPITAEVGEALSRYLREERGPTDCRALFVTQRAPHRPFKDSQIVNAIIKDALDATGQKPATPYVGSHVLRHSLATQLINRGASLDEVGDMLRHRSRSSTMIYARLDIEGLRSIAQPWPVTGGAQ
jgi:site-specific recombinase XerD